MFTIPGKMPGVALWRCDIAKVKVLQLKEIPDGGLKMVTAGGQDILLARTGEKVYAAQNSCTHLGGSLSRGTLEGTVVTCPSHGSRFDLLTGECLAWVEGLHGAQKNLALAISKPKGLVIYPVKIVDKRVMIQF